MTYTCVYSIIQAKGVRTLSKKSKKSRGNKTDNKILAINLITALINLVAAILFLIEKLTIHYNVKPA